MKNTLIPVHSNLEYLDIILNTYRGSIIISDATGKITACSIGTCHLMKLSKKEIIGSTLSELQEKGVISDSVINKCIRTKQPSEIFLYINQNTSQGIYAYAEPIFDENKNLAYVIAFSQDEKIMKAYVARMEDILKKQIFSSANITASQRRSHFVAVSKQSKLTFDYAKEVAGLDTNVILYGESGTGKEVLANYIHKNSDRCDSVFVPVNCAAIPEALMEAEIFGYEKGSFTGANKEGKIGLFELANNGTLFLDEIGELPLSLQPKLLRVLETGEIRKIGSSTTKTINIRLIAATNRNLQEMVNNGTFREDLYYRLNVFPIYIPSLRQRKEDIKPLIDYYMQIYNKKYHRQVQITDKAIQLLSSYSWPGNIRELKNVIQRYIITNGRFLLDSTLIPDDSAPVKLSDNDDAAFKENAEISRSASYKTYITNCEKKYFEQLLSHTNGDVSKVAAIANLHISSIYKKLDNLKINPKDYK